MYVSVPFYFHPAFSGYDFGANHPFRGERFASFMLALETRFPKAYARLDVRTPEAADERTLELAHTRAYIRRVKALEKRRGFLSLDTQLLPGSVDAARLIVGASVAAAEAALERGLAIGFGGLHHAGPDYGEGFCIFNDVAVAAGALLGRGLERIMILDTDAHQGNGTMDIFYSDPRVLFISLHQDPRTLYPGRGFAGDIGNGAGAGFTVNMPMPPLSVGSLYDEAMREIVMPLIDEFEPEFIIRNGGSDPLYTDVLTNLGLDLDSLSALIRSVAGEANRRKIPLLDLFLSGYGPYVTEGWLAIVRGILDLDMRLEIPENRIMISGEKLERMTLDLRKTIDQLKGHLGPYWEVF
ncbi:MAG TPA: histone deacetylase family protein [Candidatus Eisenbacteria bacterium]|uniref:Histone deacetylase family protein n=1 Tax=Eiseniibacteriota bacterium TaxID=2212470 RepID=A0A7V2ATW2_UNCEI|nr:histone deacetylase family protein [Candidatus Eisenbacteria bacterium]